MSASRRGILGGLAAFGVGRASGARLGQGIAVSQPPAATTFLGGNADAGLVGGVADQRHRLWRDLMDASWARRNRLENQLNLTGGVPPGIAACRSWKPWFRVVAADRWRQEHLPHPSLVEKLIRRQVFGDE